MKRTPLKRRSPLRGRSLRARPRAPADRTDPDERAHVLRRDGDCIGRILARNGWTAPHYCRGPFGQPEPYPVPFEHLTLEHVKPFPRTGTRAMSPKSAEFKRGDRLRRWSVAACADANVNGWTSKHRAEVLVYLERLEALGHL